MKKILFLMSLALLSNAFAITGFYKTIDDETGKAKSIIGIYQEDDEFYGKVLLTYNPDGTVKDDIKRQLTTADKVKGNPKMCGLDVLWDMEYDDDDNEYDDGKIMDPKTGKIYSCRIWEEENSKDLNVRGKIGPFGRTQKWLFVEKKNLPKEISDIKLDELRYQKIRRK